MNNVYCSRDNLKICEKVMGKILDVRLIVGVKI